MLRKINEVVRLGTEIIIFKIVFGIVHGWNKYQSQFLKASFHNFDYQLEFNTESGEFYFLKMIIGY